MLAGALASAAVRQEQDAVPGVVRDELLRSKLPAQQPQAQVKAVEALAGSP